MLVLNLGCGTKTSDSPNVVNIDWSPYLRLRQSRLLRAVGPLIARGERLERLRALPSNIMVHDLSRGLPFGAGSADAVYHSHVLEHLARGVARGFLLEVKRVLKPDGIHRIAVPDFERLCRAYVEHLAACETSPPEAARHENLIAAVIEQSVRREAHGTSRQVPWRRFVENAVLGDARRRGETHQWMYDRFSLSALLSELGYRDPQVMRFNDSHIPGWPEYRLEVDEHGSEYKPGSLYVEARK